MEFIGTRQEQFCSKFILQ